MHNESWFAEAANAERSAPPEYPEPDGTQLDGAADTAPIPPLPTLAAPRQARDGRFRRWRRTRPFWGGLLVILGGVEIFATERVPLGVVLHVGMQGLAGIAIPIIMVLCGLLLWFSPGQSLFYSVVSVLLSLGTWLTSNLGGFLIGMLLGIVGGSLAFAWTPRGAQPETVPAPDGSGPPRAEH